MARMYEDTSLKAFVFSERPGREAQGVLDACAQSGFEATHIVTKRDHSGHPANLAGISALIGPGNGTILVVDADRVRLGSSLAPLGRALDLLNCDILFAADDRFDFPDEELRRFYWKFYPRYEKRLPFVNASCVLGQADAFRAMIASILPGGLEAARAPIADQTLAHRYYGDQIMGVARDGESVRLDSEQRFFSAATNNAKGGKSQWRKVYKFEAGFVSGDREEIAGGGQPNVPLILPGPRRARVGNLDGIRKALGAAARTATIAVINRGELRSERLFRFRPNRNDEYRGAMDVFLSNLQRCEPFAVSHFNDGELTFISRHLNGDHRQKWFGRRQNRYSPELGMRLLDALGTTLPNYFVGVPCGSCHSDLGRLAKGLLNPRSQSVPAMWLHHNLGYVPRLLSTMRGRRIYFFKNELQQLNVVRKFGLQIDEQDVANVPFRDATCLYGDLKDFQFQPGAIVLLSCGMLAKILVPEWYRRNPKTTFITISSSLDDIIQLGDPNYLPYPATLPWTGDRYGRKSFHLGLKKKKDMRGMLLF